MNQFKIGFFKNEQHSQAIDASNLKLFESIHADTFSYIENHVWQDELEFQSFNFGNNNFNVLWKSNITDRIFRMTSTEFEKICKGLYPPNCTFNIMGLFIRGQFTFTKKGDRVHIKFV